MIIIIHRSFWQNATCRLIIQVSHSINRKLTHINYFFSFEGRPVRVGLVATAKFIEVLPLLWSREELKVKIDHITYGQNAIHESLSDLIEPSLLLFIEILNQRQVCFRLKGQRSQ